MTGAAPGGGQGPPPISQPVSDLPSPTRSASRITRPASLTLGDCPLSGPTSIRVPGVSNLEGGGWGFSPRYAAPRTLVRGPTRRNLAASFWCEFCEGVSRGGIDHVRALGATRPPRLRQQLMSLAALRAHRREREARGQFSLLTGQYFGRSDRSVKGSVTSRPH
jgi:hypothetical protein